MILNVLSNFLVEEAGGKALPLVLDVRDEQQVKSVVQNAVDKVMIGIDCIQFSQRIFLVGRDHGRNNTITCQPVAGDVLLF